MKNPIKILSVLVLFAGILFSSVAFAAQSQLVIFCSSWNMKCRDAKKISSCVAGDLNLKFVYLDMDDSSTQDKATDMELSVPSSIPYIYVLNSKGKVVFEELYRGESQQELEQKIKAKLK